MQVSATARTTGFGAALERFREGRIDRLEARGDLETAIERLTVMNRRRPDPGRERRLLQLRNEAFHRLDRSAPSSAWPPPHSNRFADCPTVPEVSADELDVDALRAGIFGRGALIVRGLFDGAHVEKLSHAVDEAFAAYDRSRRGSRVDLSDPWFHPFTSEDGPDVASHPRHWIRNGGGVYAAESPRAMFDLIEALDQVGARGIAEEYFGERAALSVLKTTLRRIDPDLSVESGWHQDGAFLGESVRSLNVWIALTPCGRDAPGLKMVPRRLDSVVRAGVGGAAFSWSFDSALIDELTDGQGPAWLEFEAGDAVFFDELNLHSTATRPEMTKQRKAIEAWLFAASHYPLDRVPLLL